MTPEVGATGFWPTTAEIFPLAIENLPQNKMLAHIAGQYSCLVDYTLQDSGNGNGFLDRGENFSLVLSVKKPRARYCFKPGNRGKRKLAIYTFCVVIDNSFYSQSAHYRTRNI